MFAGDLDIQLRKDNLIFLVFQNSRQKRLHALTRHSLTSFLDSDVDKLCEEEQLDISKLYQNGNCRREEDDQQLQGTFANLTR